MQNIQEKAATTVSAQQTEQITNFLAAEGHFGELLKGNRTTLHHRQGLNKLVQYSMGKFFEEENQDPEVLEAMQQSLNILSFLEEVK